MPVPSTLQWVREREFKTQLSFWVAVLIYGLALKSEPKKWLKAVQSQQRYSKVIGSIPRKWPRYYRVLHPGTQKTSAQQTISVLAAGLADSAAEDMPNWNTQLR